MSDSPTSGQPQDRVGKVSRSWKLRLLIAGLVGLALAWYLGYFKNNPEFRSESEIILRQLTSGEASATEAYENASFPFRETALVTSFVDRADRLTQTLGTFERIAKVTETEMLDTVRGKTARVAYDLEFSLAHTVGELSFLRGHDKEWRLLGFSIRVPKSLESKVKRIDAEYERIKAPDVVIQEVDAILRDVSEGRGAQVWKRASPPFRDAKSEPEFMAMLKRQNKELGPFERRLAILSSGQNARKDRAKASALLQYGEAKTTGTFEFIKVGENWRLLFFKVAIPEPLLPAR